MDEDAMWFDIAEAAHKDVLITGLKKATIQSLQILDFGRRGKSMSHSASNI